jgi:flavin-dependent dehydrogenase
LFDWWSLDMLYQGLAAAIRLKQLANEKGEELSVCVLEKGAEVGAHILSGEQGRVLSILTLGMAEGR